MRALVPTAGLGTRLRPLTDVRAKAAVPVNGDPLARRIVSWLCAQGFRDVVLNLHHHPETIARVMGDGSDLGVRLRYSWENPVLGSAGGPRHALPLVTDENDSTFLIVNGDTLTEVDLSAIVKAHRRSDALVTMVVIPNPRPDKYGGVIVEDGQVIGFTRPAPGVKSFHFIGVQVAAASAFAALPDGVPSETVASLYPKLISERRGSVAAYVCEAPFRDIGTPGDYLETSLGLAESEGNRLVASSATISPSAHLIRTAVWDDVAVGSDVQLTDCILCDGVRIPDGASFTRCAIVPAGRRSPGADERIEHTLLIREF